MLLIKILILRRNIWKLINFLPNFWQISSNALLGGRRYLLYRPAFYSHTSRSAPCSPRTPALRASSSSRSRSAGPWPPLRPNGTLTTFQNWKQGTYIFEWRFWMCQYQHLRTSRNSSMPNSRQLTNFWLPAFRHFRGPFTAELRPIYVIFNLARVGTFNSAEFCFLWTVPSSVFCSDVPISAFCYLCRFPLYNPKPGPARSLCRSTPNPAPRKLCVLGKI